MIRQSSSMFIVILIMFSKSGFTATHQEEEEDSIKQQQQQQQQQQQKRWLSFVDEVCMRDVGQTIHNNDDVNVNINDNVTLHCPAVYDGVLCWNATSAGSTITQSCPPIKGLDAAKFVSKTCGIDGTWEGKPGREKKSHGFTDYSVCYTEEALEIYNKYYRKEARPTTTTTTTKQQPV